MLTLSNFVNLPKSNHLKVSESDVLECQTERFVANVVRFFRNSLLSIVKLYTLRLFGLVKLQQPIVFKLGLFGSINTER